jgi:hypothetical protein
VLQPDVRRISVYAKPWGFRDPAHSRSRRPARAARLGRAAAGLLALALVAGACSGEDSTGPDGPRSTFDRADGASLHFEDPVATVADLMPPAGDNDKWVIAGSVFDPKTSTSVATTWVSGDGKRWERSDVRPGSSDISESFAAMTRAGDHRLAVGWVGDGQASDAAVWRQGSDRWERLDVGEDMGGEHEQWAFDVAASDTGVLVAGGENAWGEVRPRLWFSADGETFTSVDGGPGGVLDTTGQESVREVAAVDGGFVAVGSRTADNEQDGVVWFSADGESWEEVEVGTMAGPGRQALLTVVDAGDVVVAGGYVGAPGGKTNPVVWRSQDGRNWGAPTASLPLHEDNRTGTASLTVRSITADDQGLLATGGADWRPQVWRSTDAGKSWALLPNPTERGLFGDGVALVTASVVGRTTVALGLEPTVMRLDSDRWEDATSDAFPDGGVQPFATSLAEDGKVRIMTGGTYTSPRAEKRERYTGQVWTAGDDGWAPLDTDQLEDGQINDVAHYRDGFVAVGLEDFSRADSRSAGDNSSPDGLLWTSPDGKEWARIAARAPRMSDELIPGFAQNEHSAEEIASAAATEELSQPRESLEPAGGIGTQSLEAVAPLADGFIAVGATCCDEARGVEPIAVMSRDGKSIERQETGLSGAGTERFRDVCVAPDDTAIAVGITGVDGDYDAAVRVRVPNAGWSGGTSTDSSFEGPGSQQIYGCAAGEDGFIVVGSDDGAGDADVRVWTSPDGSEWTRVPSGLFGGSGDQWASAVAAVPDGGWLVGGTDTAPGDGDIALWRLDADGEDVERRDEGEDNLSGPGEQSVTSLMVDENGVTIVGDDFGRVGIWQSDTLDR